MEKLSDRVAIPPKDVMNTGLRSASELTILKKFGKPEPLIKKCSPPTPKFNKRIKYGVNVGPFKVNGLDYSVELLKQIFADVQQPLPDVYNEVKTTGVLCVRHRKKNPTTYSNHS
jgi:hypothetical protein